MSVPKRKRTVSQFEVFHHLTQMRREITDLILRDFGYSVEKAAKAQTAKLCGKAYEELPEAARLAFDAKADRDYALHSWFIIEERKHVLDLMRGITSHVYQANSIYAVHEAEAAARRLHQEEAIGLLYALTQELQYIIETLPIDANAYMRFAEMIDRQIALVRGWRKADSKKRATPVSSARFANANNNGNAGYNNASSVNGVRPDSSATAPAGATNAPEGGVVRS